MAKKPLEGRAGIFRAWDGKLTGPQPGEPQPMPERDHSWGSVKKKQSGKVFTADEVRRIVEEAVKATQEGRDLSGLLDKEPIVKEEQREEEVITIGGN